MAEGKTEKQLKIENCFSELKKIAQYIADGKPQLVVSEYGRRGMQFIVETLEEEVK